MGHRRALLVAAAAVVTVTVVAVVLAAVVGGPGAAPVKVEPLVSFALPPASVGCGGSSAGAGGTTKVPLTVSTVAGQVAETLNVCIGGKGPFPFVLDSGAGQSTIDAGLAHRLHLARDGAPIQFAGVGCTGTARPVSSGSWSLAGVDLAPQQLTAATLPQIGGKDEPDGLLGSDVLSRFGAVRIDFAHAALTLPGPEGPPLGGIDQYTGPTGPAPVSLTQGMGTTVPLTVTPVEGEISLNVAVRFARGPRRSFVVDTGSSQSVVAGSIATVQSLPPTNLAQRQDTVCSVITVPLVHTGSWSVPGVSLHRQLIGSTSFGLVSQDGTVGLLGSDQLKRYGWVVLDYTGGRLVLGSR